MPAVDPLPDPPQTSDPEDVFQTKADVLLAALKGTFVPQLNAFAASMSPIGRNMLINPVFKVAQYLTAAPTDDAYIVDRWYTLTQTAAIGVGLLGSPIESNYDDAIRLTQSQATAQRFGFAQIVEAANCRWMLGNVATLSGRVRCSAATNIRYAILANTNTADVVASDFINNWTSTNYTGSNFFNASGVRVLAVGVQAVAANTWTNLAALTTAAIASGANNLIVFIWTESALAQNVTLDCDYVQLENGATATPVERRPYAYELMLCQRYAHVRTFGSGIQIAQIAMASGNSGSGILYNLPVLPRAAPTVTVQGGYLLLNPGQSGNSAFSGTTTTCDISGNVAFNGVNLASFWASGQSAILFASGASVIILCVMEL